VALARCWLGGSLAVARRWLAVPMGVGAHGSNTAPPPYRHRTSWLPIPGRLPAHTGTSPAWRGRPEEGGTEQPAGAIRAVEGDCWSYVLQTRDLHSLPNPAYDARVGAAALHQNGGLRRVSSPSRFKTQETQSPYPDRSISFGLSAGITFHTS
jgi:hypothetical protein